VSPVVYNHLRPILSLVFLRMFQRVVRPK
jgi:hypothetical protein